MIQSNDIQNLFFLGIGGIGMSALARYFSHSGYRVFGYDRTPSPLTQKLEKEGLVIGYEDSVGWFKALELSPKSTLVVRTPAVPEDSDIYTYLRAEKYDIRKRAEILGLVTRKMRALCVAGTHGKTTTSTMLAHLFYQSEIGTNAFLGGISLNYGTNVLLQKDSNYVVVEADEYDRSFHQLTPYMSIITSVDPDHLDIYGTKEAYREAFTHYTSLITETLIIKAGIALTPRLQKGCKCYTYGVCDSQNTPVESLPDFYADHIRVGNGQICFDFHTTKTTIHDLVLGVPVWVNIENAVAAMAVAWLNGVTIDELRHGLQSFTGVQRRFNIQVKQSKLVDSQQVTYIDDYAHHPQELATAIDSIRKLYPERRLVGVFQPHLFTRTRDFVDEFATVLSTMDELILLPIYPAREEPIEGVTSAMLLERVRSVNNTMDACLMEKNELINFLKDKVEDTMVPMVILTVGAGDIDRLVPEIKTMLNSKKNEPTYL